MTSQPPGPGPRRLGAQGRIRMILGGGAGAGITFAAVETTAAPATVGAEELGPADEMMTSRKDA
jgi:hypothetical protein